MAGYEKAHQRLAQQRLTSSATAETAAPRPPLARRRLTVMLVGASAVLLTGSGAIAQASWTAPAGPVQHASVQSGQQQSPTKVTKAGAVFQGTLAKGTTADLSAGSRKIGCTSSSFTGKVPAAPGNTNAAGPVNSTINEPTFADCPTGTSLVSVSMATNSDNGAWNLALQHDPAGSKSTLTIPKAGIVLTVSGLANCKATVAPDGPITIAGSWTPGTATRAPQLSVSEKNVPIEVTGGALCPKSEKSGSFSATYDITDTTSPTSQIAITS